MFEDSLFASKRGVRTVRSRWAGVAAVMVQVLLVMGLLVAPMLRPLAMPVLKTAPAAVSLSIRRPEVKPEPVKVKPAVTNDTAMRVPSTTVAAPIESRQGGRIAIPAALGEAAPPVAMGSGMGMGLGNGLGLGDSVGAPSAPTVRVKASGGGASLRVSSGVSAGMLLMPMRPVYPVIARAAHVEGTVVISARIDKAGRIVGVQVVSGPQMLRSAAVDAVASARYRPYLLNGEATEVETTVAVNFRMGG